MRRSFCSNRLSLLPGVLLLRGLSLLAQEEPAVEAIVSVAEQRLAIVRDGELVAKFPVSTSKFGTGDAFGSYRTPLGRMRVCEKIGGELAAGAVMKGRETTGEVLPVNAPGRDPIVTRILWLEGEEEQNRHAHSRAIYIHGTPEEKLIGKPVSWGCIRMRSEDVIALYDELPAGAAVTVIAERLPRLRKFDPRRQELIANAAAKAPTRVKLPVISLSEEPRPILELLTASATPAAGKSRAAMMMKGSILLSGLSGLATAESAAAPAAEPLAKDEAISFGLAEE